MNKVVKDKFWKIVEIVLGSMATMFCLWLLISFIAVSNDTSMGENHEPQSWNLIDIAFK